MSGGLSKGRFDRMIFSFVSIFFRVFGYISNHPKVFCLWKLKVRPVLILKGSVGFPGYLDRVDNGGEGG